MKKILFGAMLISAAATIYSCSTPAHVEKDPGTNLSKFKTYMWVDLKASEDDASSRATAFADLSARNAVNEELQRWGWREVDESPDVIVVVSVVSVVSFELHDNRIE